MKRLMVGLALSYAALATEPLSEVRLAVGVFTFADVSPRMLAEAKSNAGSIFGRAGIEIEWVDCAIAGCQGRITRTMPLVRIITRQMASGFPSTGVEMGLAALGEKSGYGTDSWVFFHRVEEAAADTSSDPTVVLGGVIAHELGHLLLGVNQHTRTGIMRPGWNREHLKRAARGELTFTEEQARQMRDRIRQAANPHH